MWCWIECYWSLCHVQLNRYYINKSLSISNNPEGKYMDRDTPLFCPQDNESCYCPWNLHICKIISRVIYQLLTVSKWSITQVYLAFKREIQQCYTPSVSIYMCILKKTFCFKLVVYFNFQCKILFPILLRTFFVIFPKSISFHIL